MLRRFLSLPFLMRFAIVAWFALILSVSLRVAIAPACKATVVNIYILAAERWLSSENVYLWEPGLDLYHNPPGVTPLLTPLTWVPAKVAGILWRLAITAVFLQGLRVWLRSVLPMRLSDSQTGAVFLLVIPLVLASLNNGQMNLLVVGLLLFGTAAVARSQHRAGGLWLAAAAGLKVYPVAVGLLVAAAFPRRFLPWFVGGMAAFAVLPFLCQRPEYVVKMHRTLAFSLIHDERSYEDPNRAPQDAFLILHAAGIDLGKPAYHAVQLALALGMSALVLRVSRRGGTSREIATLALHLGCIWMTSLGPASEGPTYTLLAPSAAIVLVMAYAHRDSPGGRARCAIALLAHVLLVSPILRDAFPHGAGYRALGPLPAGGFVLLVVVVWNALLPRVKAEQPIVLQGRIRLKLEAEAPNIRQGEIPEVVNP